MLSLAPKTRRSHVILVVSLGAAVGVAMMPNFLNGGGVQAFYGSVLNMNVGFWPLRSLCEPGAHRYAPQTRSGGRRPHGPAHIYPYSPRSSPPARPPAAGTETYFSDRFPGGGPGPFLETYFAHPGLGPQEDLPTGIVNHTDGFPGFMSGWRGKLLTNPRNWVVSCSMDAGMVGFRRGVLLLLSTPYCIGFILAFLLNLILPDDLKKEEKTTVTTGVKEVETA